MSENCKDETQVQELDLQALLDATEQPGEEVETTTIFFPPLELPTENLVELEGFDKEQFHKGLKDGSYQAGLFTALINSGMDLESATTYLLNAMSVKMNLEIAKIQANATIEAAKNAQVAVEKQLA